MHPHTLHAQAAAWSLLRSLEALEQRAREALKDAEAGNTADRDIAIPSQTYGCRRQLGGYGDPTANTAIGAWAPGGPNPHAATLGALMRHLDEIAGFLPGAPGQDPVSRIQQSIPLMPPEIARDLGAGLANLDRAARKHLGIPPALTPLPSNPPCPACRLQMLQSTTAGSVVCTADCHCTGDGCRCGMPVREPGVQHIWLADHFAAHTAA